jgi:hypothetical protein
MQTVAKRRLFLTASPSFERLAGLQKSTRQGEFYQQLFPALHEGIYSRRFFLDLANAAIDIADHAFSLRKSNVIEEASNLLINLPLPPAYRKVGHYYRATSFYQQGRIAEASSIFQNVANDAPLRYRARAAQLLGIINHAKGDLGSALRLYVESCRMAAGNNWCDPHTTITAQQNIAVLKSMNGDHKGALRDLETLFPLVRAVSQSSPYKYYHYLNGLAVELGELGRVEEASNVCNILLASPYAFAYPEWRETSYDIAFKGHRSSRSVISLFQRTLPNNLLHLPERKSGPGRALSAWKEEATVTSLLEWKNKMVKEPNGEEENENIEEMNDKDMIVKLLQLTAHEGVDENKLRKVLKYAIKVFSEPNKD